MLCVYLQTFEAALFWKKKSSLCFMESLEDKQSSWFKTCYL